MVSGRIVWGRTGARAQVQREWSGATRGYGAFRIRSLSLQSVVGILRITRTDISWDRSLIQLSRSLLHFFHMNLHSHAFHPWVTLTVKKNCNSEAKARTGVYPLDAVRSFGDQRSSVSVGSARTIELTSISSSKTCAHFFTFRECVLKQIWMYLNFSDFHRKCEKGIFESCS